MAESWQVWAFMAAVFAALTAIFAKAGVNTMNPDMATFLRTAIILALLGAMLLFSGNWESPGTLDRRGILFLTLSAAATGASWLCYFRALKLGDAARVAPIDKLSVVFVAILAAVFLGESLDVRGWIGVGLIGAGAIILAI